MKRSIKKSNTPEIRNFKGELEFFDQLFSMTNTYDNNPLNNRDINRVITRRGGAWYYDMNGNWFPKEFIDLYLMK